MATDLGLLKGSVADILGLQGNAAESEANAQASDIQALGATEEARIYGTAGDIARRNAQLEGISGDILSLQQQREVRKNLGNQRAANAGAGFAASGSSLDILASSLREGYLGQQLIQTQTALNQGGYLQQGAATEAEIAAVKTSGDAATALAQAQREAAATSAANAANQSEALQAYLKVNAPETAEEKAGASLVTSTLKSPLNGPASLPQEVTDALDPTKAKANEAVNPFNGYRPLNLPASFNTPAMRDQFGRATGQTGVQFQLQ